MNVKFDHASKFRENLREYIDSFDSPVVITDGDLKIIAKNRAARFYVTGIEVGKTARGFVSDEEFIRIRDMENRETASCEINFGTVSYGANVFAIDGNRFIVVNPVASRLCERIKEIYEEMSGYDLSISDETLFGEALSRRLRTRSAAAFVTERLRENLECRKLPFFDMEKTVNRFVEELNSIGIRARVSTCGDKDTDSVSAGSEGEFLLVLAVAVLLGNDDNDRVLFEITNDDSKAYCRIILNGEIPADEYENVLSVNLEKRFEGRFSERRFWSRVAYLISNANLWDVSLEIAEERMVFTISTELTSHYTGCIFRDREKDVMSELFSIFFK